MTAIQVNVRPKRVSRKTANSSANISEEQIVTSTVSLNEESLIPSNSSTSNTATNSGSSSRKANNEIKKALQLKVETKGKNHFILFSTFDLCLAFHYISQNTYRISYFTEYSEILCIFYILMPLKSH